MRTKRFLLFAFCCLLTAVLASCGEDEDSDPVSGDVDTCAELCAVWEGLTDRQRDCIGTSWQVGGADIAGNDTCDEAGTQAECGACVSDQSLSGNDCERAYDMCVDDNDDS